MSIAANKIETFVDGVDKKQFEASLHDISDQIRLMDQKLIMKTETEISNRYENQKYSIAKTKEWINQLR
ncbi:hypothetical protein [Oceanobacillus senegalensis]|uniref:hypothetical protein n=1 Tax=Oceanobacillus senegalensis TaxID=1936063 RepID=UPI000A309FF3|nr:hypothetical protein [Oceanobacillus senegalensis]